MSRRVRILAALKANNRPMDTLEIAKVTLIPRPGSALLTLEAEKKIKRVGVNTSGGRRPIIIWELSP